MSELRVVIPAKDEDGYLRNMLSQLKDQDYKRFEVVVADGSETSIVKKICSQYNVITVAGGLPGEARNNGATNFTGKYILFLDADVSLNKQFINAAMEAIKKNKADCMSFGFVPENPTILMNLIHWIGTLSFSFMTKIGLPHGIGGAILVKNKIHNEVQGFDESIYIAEDHNYVSKVTRTGKYVFSRQLTVKLSTRRFNKEGVFLLCFKYFVIGIHRLIIGEIRHKKIPYFEIDT